MGSGGSLKSQLLPWASTRNREKSQAVTALLLGGSHNTDGAKEQSHNRELHGAPSPADPQVQVLTLWAVQVSLLGNRVLQMWSSSVGQAHSGSGWAFHPRMGTPLRKRSLDAERERERGGSCEDGDGKERGAATAWGPLGTITCPHQKPGRGQGTEAPQNS